MRDITRSLIEKVNSDWGEKSPQGTACVALLEYLSGKDPSQLSHITPGAMKLAVPQASDESLWVALTYLAGERMAALETRFEFYDDVNEEYYELDVSALKEAETEGGFVHPRTGEMIKDYKDSILLFYRLGAALCNGGVNG